MKLLLAFLAATCAYAQNANIFSASSGDITLASNASTSFTVQQPATKALQVRLLSASAACDTQTFTVQQSANGSAATATAVTPVPLTPLLGIPAPAATVTAWKASNIGTGTAAWGTMAYASGIALLDLSDVTMFQVGTGSNFTITVTNTGMASCTARISIKWSEGDLLNGATQSIPR